MLVDFLIVFNYLTLTYLYTLSALDVLLLVMLFASMYSVVLVLCTMLYVLYMYYVLVMRNMRSSPVLILYSILVSCTDIVQYTGILY